MEGTRCCLYQPILPSLSDNVMSHLKPTYVFLDLLQVCYTITLEVIYVYLS